MKPTDPNALKQSKPTPPQTPIIGKPVVQKIITPDMRDRVIIVRRDIRKGGYEVPKQGKPFEGTDEFKTAEGYVFATASYPEPPGVFVDEYYVKSRLDQERYNWVIEYPYVDKHYPRITRTYVCFRSDYMVIKEPDADTNDPTSPDLYLVDHKIEKIENDPVLDALFVKVNRIFERLPSPIITSFDTNQFQQDKTIKIQEIVSGPPPVQTALTEEIKQERTGTAKAKNTVATVPRVFPQSTLKREIPSMTRELWLGGFQETLDSEVTAGLITTPTLNPGEYSKTGEQLTEKKQKTITLALPLPQARRHKELTKEFGGGVLDENLDINEPSSGLDIEQGTYVTDSKLRNLVEFGKIRVTRRVEGLEWPNLHEEKVLTDGIYAGIKVILDKKVVSAGTNPDGTGPSIAGAGGNYTPNPNSGCPPGGPVTDLMPHDKWRTIRITSRVDLSTLPNPVTYVGTHPLDIPPTLLSIFAVCGAHGGSSGAVSNDGNPSEGVSVSVESGVLGTIGYTAIGGFHGNAMAQITRFFLQGPPQLSGDGRGVILNGIEYLPFQFLGGIGTASLVSIYAKFSQALNGDPDGTPRGSSSSNFGQVRTQTTEFRPMLTGQFLGGNNVSMIDALTGARTSGNIFTGPSSSQGAGTTDGLYNIQMTGPVPAPKVSLITNIPQSIPSRAPASGSKILAAVQVTEWRFNIWVVHLVNVIVP